MNQDISDTENPYEMKFDIGTIKHLGLQMYSTLPPVIGELVANAWDANATRVEITIPDTPIDQEHSKIIIKDDGIGMSDKDVRKKYLRIGRDRRGDEQSDKTPHPYERKIMGRKGIGKFSAFGIAKEIDVESVQNGKISHFLMNYDKLLEKKDERIIELPQLSPTGTISNGTKITLRNIIKFKNRRISTDIIRRGLARRFAVIGEQNDFEVIINDKPISIGERDLKGKLAKDTNEDPYLWEYNEKEIKDGTGWTVSGWIGALKRTSQEKDKIERGIVIMARGKLVQEPFVFDAVVGQQFALSYLVGELHAEFVDEAEDTIATTRNSLVWDTEENIALKEWGQKEVNKIASLWAKKRRKDNEQQLQENEAYKQFQEQAEKTGNKRALRIADKLVRQTIEKNLDADAQEFEPLIQTCLDFLEFDAFWEIAEELTETAFEDTETLLNLFREWEIVEAKEMARVTKGRITTIEKLQHLIENNELEKPTLHNFLKEFPWVIDPRWTLVADEMYYSQLLREHFPESDDVPEENKRIDFLCVSEGTKLVVVEIKRPKSRVSMKELGQITDYVEFIEAQIPRTSDPDYRYEEVTGYLLCGDLVNRDQVKVRQRRLAQTKIYVRRYIDLLSAVERSHAEFLKRYNELQEAKQRTENRSQS
ncbi:MAG: ATP-binding protein [Candidatus Poribacteria bacterium]|nr:ATP-binding protein [Candidatus Poribacteria bacterium]